MTLVNVSSYEALDVVEAGPGGGVSVGIDFGTTNSVICFYREGEHICLGDRDGYLIPTVIAVHKNHQQILIGGDAVRCIGDQDYGVVSSIKRLVSPEDSVINGMAVGQNALLAEDGLIIFDKKYQFADLIACILLYLKGVAEDKLDATVDSCVITVPARFDDVARGLVRSAAGSAGMRVLRVLNEPTAASVAYGVKEDDNGIYAVYDLGGGTFDVSILRVQPGLLQVVATGGDVHLGGDDVDDALMTSLSGFFGKKSSAECRILAKSLKHQVCSNGSGTIVLDDLSYTMSLRQMNLLIEPIVRQTIDIVDMALVDARKKEGPIDLRGIIVVGGACRMSLVKEMLEQRFGVDVMYREDMLDIAVAVGAAMRAWNLVVKKSGDLLIDVLPLSIGVEMMGGVVEKVISRNTPIPISISHEFTTFQDNQTGIDLHVVQGEREMAKDCRSLGRMLIGDIVPMRAGLARAIVTFSIDSDGVLVVSAKDKATGVQQHMEIIPTFGVDAGQMRDMLRDSANNAKEDMLSRLLVEAVTESFRAISVANRMLKECGRFLEPGEGDAIRSALNSLEVALGCAEGSPREEILLLRRDLDRVMLPFVERVAQQALIGLDVGKLPK